jgi:hypothetical protein
MLDEIAKPPPDGDRGGGSGIMSFDGDNPENSPSPRSGQYNFSLPADRAARQRGLAARAKLRRQRLVEHLHRLGPQPLGYFLREIEAGASIPEHLEKYSTIDPNFVRDLGGDQYPPLLWAIDGGRR